jgi:anti-sigma regulatory factor (Ser/Thr protein kinase)
MSDLPIGELARERLALVVSELVTNAVRHAGLLAGDPIELEVTRDNGSVWISVHDGGPGFSPSVRRAEIRTHRGTGNGLAIVDSLANEWGVNRGPDGCTVWCAVDAARDGLAAPRARHA